MGEVIFNGATQMVLKSEVTPSYLYCFDDDKVNILFKKKSSVSSEAGDIPEDFKKDSFQDEFIEKCDLTGDPLEVDLGGNDSLHIENFEQTCEKWTLEESEHFPISVRQARRELNKILQGKKETSSTYVVCNSEDSKKTVLLGGNNTTYMACSVHVRGIIPQNEVENKIEEFMNDHLNNCFNSSNKINYSVKMNYNIYGKKFRNNPTQNANLRESSKHGNISVDIFSPKNVFKISETDEGRMTMTLKIVAGHVLLKLNFIWMQLFRLQYLINILSDSESCHCEETVICKDPLDKDVIFKNIVQLFSTKFLKRGIEKDVNLNHLRQEDFLDGLWNILIRCENISVLRDSFNFLFEELAEGRVKILPIKDDCSRISTMIKGILQSRIGMPTISLPESVELLFELGAQKLKQDFQVILAQFIHGSKNSIDSVWKKLYQKDLEEAKKCRRTRTTRMTNVASQYVTSNINQLAYLSQLYLGSELIYFLKDQVRLNDDGFRYFCKCVEKEYVAETNRITDFNEIFQNPVQEMFFDLSLKNASILESTWPSRWTLSMETGQQTTIYDLSASPIFPPTIYDYEVPESDPASMIYYVTKMSRSIGLFDV